MAEITRRQGPADWAHKGNSYVAKETDVMRDSFLHKSDHFIKCPNCGKHSRLSTWKVTKDKDENITNKTHFCSRCNSHLILMNEEFHNYISPKMLGTGGPPKTNPNIQRSGRLKLIRLRIRNGKIQRRVKRSAIPGFTLRKGRLIRMSVKERRDRRLGARRAKIKRRAERSRIRMKLRRSLMRRKALGLG